MRLPVPVALVLVSLTSGPAAAQSFDGGRMIQCQQDVTRASVRYLARRRQVLEHCIAMAMRCPAALAGGATAADDPCLAAVAARCRAKMPAVERASARLEGTGPRCVAPAPPGRGVPVTGFFDPEGLGFEGVGAFCPGETVEQTSADASRCQRVALACTADGAVATAAPRARELLARLGVPVDAGCGRGGRCGNGALDGDEECDDGAANSDTAADACRTTCVDYFCGDGTVDSDEECDDGNDVDGDGCDGDCLLTDGSCGDGVVDPDEECDAGRQNSNLLPDHCRRDCALPTCGDGVVDPGAGEGCEPPGSLLCDDDCTLRLPLTGPAAAAAGAPDDLDRCQEAIVAGGARLFDRSRVLLGACVAGLERCLLAFPEERDPDGTKLDACFTRAVTQCDSVLPGRAALLSRLAQKAATRCASVPLARLLDHMTGLGFDQAAAACPPPADGSPTTGDLLTCVYGGVQCHADNAVARTLPRAYDLLWELDLDPDTDLPCVTPAEVE